MNKDKIKEVVIEKTEQMAALCKKISSDFEMEHIHDFRVTFKYLRSFLSLLRMHNDNHGLKIPEKIKNLYYIAGRIRDAQIELNALIKNEADLQDYKNNVNQIIASQKKEWGKNYTEKTLASFVKQVNHYNFEDLPTGVLNNFLNTRMDAIQTTMGVTDPNDQQIHSIRKNAKDIIYATNAVNNKKEDNNGEVKDVPLKDLNLVATEIGSYNDERQQLNNISQFAEQTNAIAEKDRIAQIKKDKGPKIKLQKLNILKLVKGLFTKRDKKKEKEVVVF